MKRFMTPPPDVTYYMLVKEMENRGLDSVQSLCWKSSVETCSIKEMDQKGFYPILLVKNNPKENKISDGTLLYIGQVFELTIRETQHRFFRLPEGGHKTGNGGAAHQFAGPVLLGVINGSNYLDTIYRQSSTTRTSNWYH